MITPENAHHKVLYMQIKRLVPPVRDKKYLDWVRTKHPEKEIHHLFGSYIAGKRTDYLVLPLTREQHLEAEKNKSEFAIEHLAESIALLITYLEQK